LIVTTGFLLVGEQRVPGQQADIFTTESAVTAQEIHEESYAVCHHDEGVTFCYLVLLYAVYK